MQEYDYIFLIKLENKKKIHMYQECDEIQIASFFVSRKFIAIKLHIILIN